MKGVELAARFSWITNSLKYCGPEEASRQFIDYFENHSNEDELKNSIRRFEALYPYLETIAHVHSKNFYDYDVVEAYWIGNKLLDKFNKKEMNTIVEKLMKRGMPSSIGKDLIDGMPENAIPHHNFHVMYMGVGRTTGKVETNLQNMDRCRVSYGKVLDIHSGNLIVSTKSLKHSDKGYYLGEEEVKTAVYLESMLKDVQKGDYVGLHWGNACLILDKHQLENLESYTERVINIMNRGLR